MPTVEIDWKEGATGASWQAQYENEWWILSKIYTPKGWQVTISRNAKWTKATSDFRSAKMIVQEILQKEQEAKGKENNGK